MSSIVLVRARRSHFPPADRIRQNTEKQGGAAPKTNDCVNSVRRLLDSDTHEEHLQNTNFIDFFKGLINA